MHDKNEYPKRGVRLLAWLLMCSLLWTVMPVVGYAGEQKKAKKDQNVIVEKPKVKKERSFVEPQENAPENQEDIAVIHAPDFYSFMEAATTGVCDDPQRLSEKSFDTAGDANLWQNKRLLVRGKEGFDPQGAIRMIQGYDQMFVLEYETEEKTEQAYLALKNAPDIRVDADILYRQQELEMDIESEQMLLPSAPSLGRKEGGAAGSTILAAVLDTGYDMTGNHEPRVLEGLDLTGTGAVQDENGHGSAMANLILEHTPDSVNVLPVKIADENGYSSALRLYLGIRYAMEQGVHVINISMGAYRAAYSETVSAAIRQAAQKGIFVVVSAGNGGQDVIDFSPANLQEAIVVSAVQADQKRAAYSNYGATVDYCAYGSVRARGLRREEISISGTSVSAAIVSALIAQKQADKPDISYEELTDSLNRNAIDLGEPGKDSWYGRGFLSVPFLRTEKDQEDLEMLPELLACDWKSLSNDRLNTLIGETDERLVRVFLDNLTKSELAELLARADILQKEHIEIVCDADGKEQYRNVDTLYHYLYSKRLEEYHVQTKISGTYYMYIQNTTRKVCLTTNQNRTKCTLHVRFFGTTTNPADNPQISISGVNAGAISLSEAKVDNVKTFTDDNGHINTIGQVGISGISVAKEAHTKMIGQTKSEPLNENHGSDLWSGGFVSYGTNLCADTRSSQCKLMVGVGDLELAKENKVQTYQLNFSNPFAAQWGSWGDWSITQQPSCSQAGSRCHTRAKICSNCGKPSGAQTGTEEMPQLAHDFSNGIWHYGVNGQIQNGERWLQCGYACGAAIGGSGYDVNGAWWKQGYQYLQKIAYQYMDVNGQYPAASTEHICGYYPAGAVIPGWQYADTGTSEFMSAGTASYSVTDQAQEITIRVPRKKYHIVYHGNGADTGETMPQNNIYCGKEIKLRKNGFSRIGYTFTGWSKSKRGTTLKKNTVKNLSYKNNETVTLYAQWKPTVIRITTDSQGANINQGTREIYEQYGVGFYRDAEFRRTFPNHKIEIPQKTRKDDMLLEGIRQQKFLGYYTRRDGNGNRLAGPDGALAANINMEGDYRYFKKDSTVYANWEDMYAVQFHPNLSKQELAALGESEDGTLYDPPVICPDTCFKEKRKPVTISYEAAVVPNEKLAKLYRFMGYSLTPRIASEDEIVLSREKPVYVHKEDWDLTLYAQWDTSFMVAYIGNGQDTGNNYCDSVRYLTDSYQFRPNLEGEEQGRYFVKTTEKPTIDIATGKWKNEAGKPYMEKVPYSFLGWSMAKETDQQEKETVYQGKDGSYIGLSLFMAAKDNWTIGKPADDFGEYDVSDTAADMPFLNLYAVWDEYPQIHAADMYLPLSDAQNGSLTEPYLLAQAVALDLELQSKNDPEGRLAIGEDKERGTSFVILDYQASDFTGATADMGLTVTFQVKDRAGNITEKMVTIYLADTAGKALDTGTVRFISEEYIDTLAEDSVWRDGAYADALQRALHNQKSGEEYTSVTPIQKAFGVCPVLKAGSGVWEHVREIWKFSRREVLQIQDYVEQCGLDMDPSDFLERFGACRVQ